MVTIRDYVKQLVWDSRRRALAWLAPRLQKLLAATGPSLERLARKIDVTRQYRVEVGHPERVVILLVGCGGTGSVRRATA